MVTFFESNKFKHFVVSLVAILVFGMIGPHFASANVNLDKKDFDSEENTLTLVLPNPEDETVDTQEVLTVAAIVGIVVGALAIGKSFYDAGYYAAEVSHKKHGLTSGAYKIMRPALRPALLVYNPLVAQGFDDYFYGL